MPGAMVPMGLELKVEAIKGADFKTARALMPTTVQKAVIEGVPMIMVAKATDQIMPVENIIGYIEHELIILSAMVNIDQRLNIQRHQLQVIAQELYDAFKAESMEDISVCFRRGATGLYGEIYRLDGAVILGWMRAYLEEKYAIIESEVTKARKQEAENKIDYKAFIERRQKEMETPKVPTNAKENEYQRYKLQMQKERASRKQFQNKLHKISSEFYEGKNQFGDIKTYEDDKGFFVLAASEEDAKKIYELATQS